MQKTVVIVGGGVAGMVAAMTCQQEGWNVHLVEAQAALGGLLQSWQSPEGDVFDYGTHFLRETGLQALDDMIFQPFIDADWHHLPALHAGHVYGGVLNPRSIHLDLRSLPRNTYLQAVEELLLQAAQTDLPAPENLEMQLTQTFGSLITHEVMAPALKRYYGAALCDLACNTHLLAGLTRVLMLDPETTRMLKALPAFDQRLAFHADQPSAMGLTNFYPKRAGIGLWVQKLQSELVRRGVHLHLNNAVVSLAQSHNMLTALCLKSGQKIRPDQVIWTVPVPLLARLAAIHLPLQTAPRRRQTTLVHLVFNRPLACTNTYLNIYDADLNAFRMTLYDNIGRQMPDFHEPERFRCTLELMHDADKAPLHPVQAAQQDLLKMQLIDPSHQLLAQHTLTLKETFPVLTAAFLEASARCLETVQAQLHNVHFCGRQTGQHFLMADIMRDAYQKSCDLSKGSEG